MRRIDVAAILNGPHSEIIRKWVEGGVVQMWSKACDPNWVTLNDQERITFYVDEIYRIKPDPVFEEIAVFRTTSKSMAAVLKSQLHYVPNSWERISDWVKVEIKDET